MVEKPSLLAGAALQAELIPIENLPDDIFDAEENPGVGDARYTAERFFRKRPDDYRLCVTLIAARIGRLHIARLLKVHHMTVAAVEEREGVAIDIEKERIRKNIRLAVGNASERLPDIMASLPANQVPLATAILIDKLAQLDGEPTQRVEHTHKVQLTHEQLAQQITAFPDAIEVAVEPTHPQAEHGDQKTLADSGSPTASDFESDKPSS